MVTIGSLDDIPTNWGVFVILIVERPTFIDATSLSFFGFSVPKTELWPEHRLQWIKGIELQKRVAKL